MLESKQSGIEAGRAINRLEHQIASLRREAEHNDKSTRIIIELMIVQGKISALLNTNDQIEDEADDTTSSDSSSTLRCYGDEGDKNYELEDVRAS